MTGPMLTIEALAPLRAIDEASLIHTARRSTVVSVRGAGGVYTDTPTLGLPIKARLNPVGDDVDLRSDQPSGAKRFELSVPSGTSMSPGDQWSVAGTTNGFAWTRLVKVDHLRDPRSHQLRRRAICSDVASNPVTG